MSTRSELELYATATGELARRGGALGFALGQEGRNEWRAVASFSGPRVMEGRGPTPFLALTKLAIELLGGQVCRRCNHVISLSGSDPTFCQWRFRMGIWRPGCGLPVQESIPMIAGRL